MSNDNDIKETTRKLLELQIQQTSLFATLQEQLEERKSRQQRTQEAYISRHKTSEDRSESLSRRESEVRSTSEVHSHTRSEVRIDEKREIQTSDVSAAYRQAAIDSIEDSGLRWCNARGQRVLLSQWMGAKFAFRRGAIGTFATLTDAQRAAIDAADAAGRATAQKAIENAGE